MNEKAILMPRIGINDDFAVIGSWYAKNGEKVSKGQVIASLETTKETVEFESEYDGYIFYQYAELDEVEVGKQLAVVTDDPDYSFPVEEQKNSLDNLNITKKARELVEKYKLDISILDSASIIREEDVRKLLKSEFTVERSRSNDLIIVAGGGFAKMCMDIINLSKAYSIRGIIDDGIAQGTIISGIPVLGSLDLLPSLHEEGYMTSINAIGSIAIDNKSEHFYQRKKAYEKIKNAGFFIPTLIHPSARISSTAQIGEGCVIMENAVIGPDAIIGDDVIVNTGAIVSHDCVICNHARISPGAILAGDVKVGENALIGMNVSVYLGLKIGNNAIISNGQNIFSDVADNAVIK